MVKVKNQEQQTIMDNRIVDIMLVVEYMKEYDIYNQFFTEIGDGYLQGLATNNKDIKFIPEDKYIKLEKTFKGINKETKRIVNTNQELKAILEKQSKIIRNYKQNYRKKFF